jgi:hypothetical protein
MCFGLDRPTSASKIDRLHRPNLEHLEWIATSRVGPFWTPIGVKRHADSYRRAPGKRSRYQGASVSARKSFACFARKCHPGTKAWPGWRAPLCQNFNAFVEKTFATLVQTRQHS